MAKRVAARVALATIAVAALTVSGCDGSAGGASTSSSAPSSSSATYDPTAYGDPTGVGCAGVPAGDGDGSFAKMRSQDVATAIAANPLTTTFAAALAAEPALRSQLAKASGVTVFVPVDPAFAALPPDQAAALVNDPTQRKAVLDYAVVAQQLVPPQLVAPLSVSTLAGPSRRLTFGANAGAVTVNGVAAVVCSNILTANATVYLVDKVLLPS